MKGNEMTDMEKNLWKGFFLISDSTQKVIERFHVLNEEIEKEINIMNAPSKENVSKLELIERTLYNLSITLMQHKERLLRLNPHFYLN